MTADEYMIVERLLNDHCNIVKNYIQENNMCLCEMSLEDYLALRVDGMLVAINKILEFYPEVNSKLKEIMRTN